MSQENRLAAQSKNRIASKVEKALVSIENPANNTYVGTLINSGVSFLLRLNAKEHDEQHTNLLEKLREASKLHSGNKRTELILLLSQISSALIDKKS